MKDQFNAIKDVAEEFAVAGQTHAVINLEGTDREKIILSKLIEIYNLSNEVDYDLGLITWYEKNTRVSAYHILMMSLHNFKIKESENNDNL